MPEVIGAVHDFEDPAYAEDWASRFRPTPPRMELFRHITEKLASHPLPFRRVVELGVGPGYLAAYVLERIPDITYEGLDFSAPMRAMAAERLASHRSRIRLAHADLLADWTSAVRERPGAAVSTWSLHDLGSEDAIAKVYREARELLPVGGLLLNGDFVKPEETAFEYEPGRITVGRHLELLRAAGFRRADCLVYLEKEVDHPTSANNYACFEAVR